MAQKDPSESVKKEIQERSMARQVLDAGAKEFGFAVNSIRQEVVEKGWFGEKVTPAMMQEWGHDPVDQGEHEPDIAGPQDFSRDDLYGREPDDGLDLVPDQEQDRERDR